MNQHFKCYINKSMSFNEILCVSFVLSFVTFVVKHLNFTTKDSKVLTKDTRGDLINILNDIDQQIFIGWHYYYFTSIFVNKIGVSKGYNGLIKYNIIRYHQTILYFIKLHLVTIYDGSR